MDSFSESSPTFKPLDVRNSCAALAVQHFSWGPWQSYTHWMCRFLVVSQSRKPLNSVVVLRKNESNLQVIFNRKGWETEGFDLRPPYRTLREMPKWKNNEKIQSIQPIMNHQQLLLQIDLEHQIHKLYSGPHHIFRASISCKFSVSSIVAAEIVPVFFCLHHFSEPTDFLLLFPPSVQGNLQQDVSCLHGPRHRGATAGAWKVGQGKAAEGGGIHGWFRGVFEGFGGKKVTKNPDPVWFTSVF